jgi:hypothetical protein
MSSSSITHQCVCVCVCVCACMAMCVCACTAGLEDYELDLDGLPFTTLVYGNGPGTLPVRENLTDVDTSKR